MDTNLFWLLPAIYAIHIVEEAPRFIGWTRRYPKLFSSRFNVKMFIFGNTIFMLYVLLSVLLAVTVRSDWAFVLGLSVAGWTFSNFLLHALTTLSSGIYSPGTVTACLLYAPVSLYIYYVAWQDGLLTPANAVLSLLIGFSVMYLPFLASPKLDKVNLETTKNPVFRLMLK